MTNDRIIDAVKNEVRDYWNSNPCGTQFTDLDWGTKKFFDEVERFRYEIQPFMRDLIGFDDYSGKSILEIGCGLGTDLLQFARGGSVVTGVDLSEQSIALAKKRFDLYDMPVTLRPADAEQLPFDSNTFDVVYSFGVLHHTPDTRRSLQEAYRVLKPGGTMILMLYHRRSLHVLLGVPLMLFRKSWRRRGLTLTDNWIRVYDGENNPLGKAYTRSEVRTLLPSMTSMSFTTCDPMRRHWPAWMNWINQRLFARRYGFYLVMKGVK